MVYHIIFLEDYNITFEESQACRMLKGGGRASGTLGTGQPTVTSKQRLNIQKITNPYTGHIIQKNGLTIKKFISDLNVVLSGCIKYIVVVIATNPRIVIKSICIAIFNNLLVRSLLADTLPCGLSISIINELFMTLGGREGSPPLICSI